MTEQHGTPGQDRLESLICALIELKSNIKLVEEQHPALGNDLSSLCDLAISHLSQPGDTPPEQPALPRSQQEPAGVTADQCLDLINRPAQINYKAMPEQGTSRKKDFIISVFDKAGDCMVSGLDRMGDGIIFAFEKLLSLAPQKKPRDSEDTAQATTLM